MKSMGFANRDAITPEYIVAMEAGRTAVEYVRSVPVLANASHTGLHDRASWNRRLGHQVATGSSPYQPIPAKPMSGVPANMKPLEANALYEEGAAPLLFKSGAYPLIGGDSMRIAGGQKKSNLIVHETELDNWDRVLVVRYPGRRTFFELVTNPAYLKVMPYKLASLKVLLTPVRGDLVIPDLRWMVGGACLAIFLLVGWVRAARRVRQ